MTNNKKQVIILGIRGVPAQHGGFETFAEFLCLYLINKDWKVIIYCQEEGDAKIYETQWEGIKRIHVSTKNTGPLGTIIFDLKTIIHSLRYNGVFLTLGYNTAVFNILHRLFGKKNIINMDGIEWKRQKWGQIAKTWFWINERLGCWFGNHLVADHPKIKDHLASRVKRDKIRMIAYGGREIINADENLLKEYAIEKNNYAILIARPEPENSVLEIVTAFSQLKTDIKLVVLGKYDPENNAYQKSVLDIANNNIIFTGAIYEADKIAALRLYTKLYIHGHQVGGTNPSLVEAIAASNAILAHDNQFNRWVAKEGAVYFSDALSIKTNCEQLFTDESEIKKLQLKSQENFKQNFQWDDILKQYEDLLKEYA